jgi:hypothetical protein
MMPITVTRMIDQTEVPSDTAASSAALTWPVIATSATPMPTWRAGRPASARTGATGLVVHDGTWEVCEAKHYKGKCIILEKGEYAELKNFNDMMSSVREIDPKRGPKDQGEHK